MTLGPGRPRPVRTFIYGSCVSRDTFEFLRPLGYELIDYMARQSLLSVFARLRSERPQFDASSRFQRRMIERDLGSALLPTLRQRAHEIDLLVWDLCDERLGAYVLPHGVATRSIDTISTGLDEVFAAQGELLEFGSDGHLALWTRRLRDLRAFLSEHGLLSRLLLLAPAWAETSSAGGPSPSSFGREPTEANRQFAAYHMAAVEVLGCPVVTRAASVLRSDRDHQWGEAPFHYVRADYEALSAELDAVVRPRPLPRGPEITTA